MNDIKVGQTLLTAGKHYTCIATGKDILVLQEKKVELKEKLKPLNTEEVDLEILREITLQDLDDFVVYYKSKGGFISKGVKYYIAKQYIGYSTQQLTKYYKQYRALITNNILNVSTSNNNIAKADVAVLALCRWKLNNK